MGNQHTKKNYFKNRPYKFIRIHSGGYVMCRKPEHPRAYRGYVYLHIIVVETILGKSLPLNAVIHHVDGNRKNNSPSNLVVCENHAYHLLIHARSKAHKATGNANLWYCCMCQQYKEPNKFYVRVDGTGRGTGCKECSRKYASDYRLLNREAHLLRKREAYLKNRQKCMVYDHARRAIKRGIASKWPKPQCELLAD